MLRGKDVKVVKNDNYVCTVRKKDLVRDNL